MDHATDRRAPRHTATGRRRPPTLLSGTVALSAVVVAAVLLAGPGRVGEPVWMPDLDFQLGEGSQQNAMPSMGALTPFDQRGGEGSPVVAIVFAAIILVVTALILALIAWVVVRAIRNRERRRRLTEVENAPDMRTLGDAATPDAPTLLRGFDLALEVLDSDREPSDAVVTAWLGLQQAAERSGVRRGAAETPTEFTQRILVRLHADEVAARTLLDLYQGVRFGGRHPGEADIRQARDALTVLQAGWGAAQPGSPDPLAGGRLATRTRGND